MFAVKQRGCTCTTLFDQVLPKSIDMELEQGLGMQMWVHHQSLERPMLLETLLRALSWMSRSRVSASTFTSA